MSIALIELEEMEFYAFHGCYYEEQLVGNRFLVNISLTVDCAKAVQTDNIMDALNYVEVHSITKKEMAITSHLVEHVTQRILDAIMLRFPQIDTLKVKVSKMHPPVGAQMEKVSVTLEHQGIPY